MNTRVPESNVVSDEAGTSHTRPRVSRWFPVSSEGWIFFGLGVALVIYGVAQIVLMFNRTGRGSLLGLVLILAGVAMFPYRVVGFVCGAALVAVGGYMLISNYSTLQSLMVTGFGILSIVERMRPRSNSSAR